MARRRGEGRERDPLQRLQGLHPVLEALRARRRVLHRLRLRPGLRGAEVSEVLAAAEAAGVPVEECADAEPGRPGPAGPAGAAISLEAGPLPELDLMELAAAARAPRTLVALDGVEDPQNLGAIARVAEGAGVGGLVLTRRHAPPLSPAVARASAGAIEWLPTARVPNLVRALNQLKSEGFWVLGCDLGGGQDLFTAPGRWLAGDRVVVLGAEGRGLRPGVRDALDHRLCIPLRGRVDSLNVSAAAAVVLFELRRRDGPAAVADSP